MLVRNGAFVFPHTDDEVRRDFAAFCRLAADTFVEKRDDWEVRTGCPTPRKLFLFRQIRVGNLLADRFHWPHMVRTSTLWMPSAHAKLGQWKKSPRMFDQARARIRRAGGGSDDRAREDYQLVRLNSALLTVTHFRPCVSKFLCDTLQAEVVLDFSAGWGDRLTGFLAAESVREIDLIDPRAGSIDGCQRQHAFVRSDKTLRTHQRGAEEVMPRLPSGKYDLVISSPPYFDLEQYGETAKEAQGQIRTKVGSNDEYLRVFLRPVLTHAARLLRPGGVLALNVDDNARAGVFLCEPALAILRGLPQMELLGTAGLKKGKGFGQGLQTVTKTKAEPIYLFRRRQR